jgi:hypothetical protein
MINRPFAQGRLNPEGAIMFGTAARYRRATVDSSHDDAHSDSSALNTGASRPQPFFVGSFFFTTPCTGDCARMFEMLPAFRAYLERALLRGMAHPFFQWAH